MKIKTQARGLGMLTLLLAATAAQAHPGHGSEGFATGLAHPFLGLDHLLAMAVVGVWSAAALKPAQRLAGPAVFLALLLLGAALPLTGLVLPGLESAVATSVLALGVLMLAAQRIPAAAGLALIGLAGVLHGIAHGSELAQGHAFAVYAAGFMAGSALLHGAGLALGAWLHRQRAWAWRAAALGVGASGALMLATRL